MRACGLACVAFGARESAGARECPREPAGVLARRA